MSAVRKACPVLLREKRGRREILAFRHPTAGLQIVKGTIEPGESPDAAALRELAEESGVTDAHIVGELGRSSDIADGQEWVFYHCAAGEQPVRWIYAAPDDGGQVLSFFWHPLEDEPDEQWHPVFVRALAFIRGAVLPSA